MSIFGEFLYNLKTFGLEWYHRYYSTYPGIVVDNRDPEQRGRILFKAPSILGDKVHPVWALPSDARFAGKNTGEFLPPYIGDTVELEFEHGDLNYPMFHGGYWAKKEMPSDFLVGYPNVKGWVFKSGQKVLIDESSGKRLIRIEDPLGLKIVIDHTLGVTIDTPENDRPIFIGAASTEPLVLGNVLMSYMTQLHEKLDILIEILNNPEYAEGNLGLPVILSGQVISDYTKLQSDLDQLKQTFVDKTDTNVVSQMAFTKRKAGQ